MKLTDAQLKRFGKAIIDCLVEEISSDKPFGSDEWPDVLAGIVSNGCEHCDQEVDWADVEAAINQLLDVWEKAL